MTLPCFPSHPALKSNGRMLWMLFFLEAAYVDYFLNNLCNCQAKTNLEDGGHHLYRRRLNLCILRQWKALVNPLYGFSFRGRVEMVYLSYNSKEKALLS